MRNVHWLASVIAWDGILPIVVALVPVFVKLAMPRNDAAILLSSIILPNFAAIIRSALASWQLQRVCNGTMPFGRQAGLTLAILCLLLFEILVSCVIFDPRIPNSVWFTIGGLYAVYLMAILWALRPRGASSLASASG